MFSQYIHKKFYFMTGWLARNLSSTKTLRRLSQQAGRIASHLPKHCIGFTVRGGSGNIPRRSQC